MAQVFLATPRGTRTNQAGSLELEELELNISEVRNEFENNSPQRTEFVTPLEDGVQDDKQQIALLHKVQNMVQSLKQSIGNIHNETPSIVMPPQSVASFQSCETLCGQPVKNGTSNGPSKSAKFTRPYGIACLTRTFLLVTDTASGLLRFVKLNREGVALHVGTVTGATWLKPRTLVPISVDNTTGAINQLKPGQDSNAVLVCDSGHHKIRMVVISKHDVCSEKRPDVIQAKVRVVCGTGQRGLNDGVAEVAKFNSPSGVCVMNDGSIIVADTGNHAIRQIRLEPNSGQFMVSTIAGGRRDILSKRIIHGYKDGQGTNALFDAPVSVVAVSKNKLVVADSKNRCLRSVRLRHTKGCTVSTLTGAPPGHIENLDISTTRDGNSREARFAEPGSLVVDNDSGAIFMSDLNTIRVGFHSSCGISRSDGAHQKPDTSLHILTLTGKPSHMVATSPRGQVTADLRHNDGRLEDSLFRGPKGMCLHPHGLLICDTDNHCIRLLRQPERLQSLSPSSLSYTSLSDEVETKSGRYSPASTKALRKQSSSKHCLHKQQKHSRWDENVTPSVLQYHPEFQVTHQRHNIRKLSGVSGSTQATTILCETTITGSQSNKATKTGSVSNKATRTGSVSNKATRTGSVSNKATRTGSVSNKATRTSNQTKSRLLRTSGNSNKVILSSEQAGKVTMTSGQTNKLLQVSDQINTKRIAKPPNTSKVNAKVVRHNKPKTEEGISRVAKCVTQSESKVNCPENSDTLLHVETESIERLLKWNRELSERNIWLESTLFETIRELRKAKARLAQVEQQAETHKAGEEGLISRNADGIVQRGTRDLLCELGDSTPHVSINSCAVEMSQGVNGKNRTQEDVTVTNSVMNAPTIRGRIRTKSCESRNKSFYPPPRSLSRSTRFTTFEEFVGNVDLNQS